MLPQPRSIARQLAAPLWVGILVAASMLMGLTGCQSVFLASSWLPDEAWPEKSEIELAAKTYQEILQTEPKSNRNHLSQMLSRVGQRVAAAADRPEYEWEFTLFSGPQQSAFCLPGGKVGVYEGLLPVCTNEAGLATVLSHEIAHILSNHGRERMAPRILAEESHFASSFPSPHRTQRRMEILKEVYGIGSGKAAQLPFSRSQEEEADSIGLLLMARAGYDPQEASRFWVRFQQSAGTKRPDLLAKHPNDEYRLLKLAEIVPRAMSVYQKIPQRHSLGEQIPVPAVAVRAAKNAITTVPPLESTAPAEAPASPPATAKAQAGEAEPPAAAVGAITVAPAPIVQVAATENSPPSETPWNTPTNTLSGVGDPTVEGQLLPPTASPIVTASVEVMAVTNADEIENVAHPTAASPQQTDAPLWSAPTAPEASVHNTEERVPDGWRAHRESRIQSEP